MNRSILSAQLTQQSENIPGSFHDEHDSVWSVQVKKEKKQGNQCPRSYLAWKTNYGDLTG